MGNCKSVKRAILFESSEEFVDLYQDCYYHIAEYIDDSYTWKNFMLASRATRDAGMILQERKKLELNHRITKSGKMLITASKLCGYVIPFMEGFDKHIETRLKKGDFYQLSNSIDKEYNNDETYDYFSKLLNTVQYTFPVLDIWRWGLNRIF